MICYIPIVIIIDNDIKGWSMAIDKIFVSYRIIKPEYILEPEVFYSQRSYIGPYYSGHIIRTISYGQYDMGYNDMAHRSYGVTYRFLCLELPNNVCGCLLSVSKSIS